MPRLALLLLVASTAARAWDPTDAASIDARREGLRRAWAGKGPAAVAADKLDRARQAAKPAWVSRTAFRVDDGPRRLYLGVGATRLPRAALESVVLEEAPETPRGAIPLDWYLDEATATLYALLAEERR